MEKHETPTQYDLDKAKEVMKAAGYISVFWHRLDVMDCIEKAGLKATKRNVEKVVEALEKNHNAEAGINWDVINTTVDLVLKP